MESHAGRVLQCLAGSGCSYLTPFDDALRKHVKEIHPADDRAGLLRCPHCGAGCNGKPSFVSHHRSNHHPIACSLCESVLDERGPIEEENEKRGPIRHENEERGRKREGRGNENQPKRSRKQAEPKKLPIGLKEKPGEEILNLKETKKLPKLTRKRIKKWRVVKKSGKIRKILPRKILPGWLKIMRRRHGCLCSSCGQAFCFKYKAKRHPKQCQRAKTRAAIKQLKSTK